MFARTTLHTLVSYFVIFVVLLIMGLHPFVAHEHGGHHVAGVSFVSAHTGISEREEGEFALLASFALVLGLVLVPKLHFALRQRGFQHVEIPLRLPHFTMFSQGIIHIKTFPTRA
jgi:hypothetical protein